MKYRFISLFTVISTEIVIEKCDWWNDFYTKVTRMNWTDQKKKEKEKEFETHWVHENLEETTSWIAK